MAQLQNMKSNNIQPQKPSLANKELASEARRKLTPEQQKELNFSLIKAVKQDKIHAIEQLLNLGANIEASDSNNFTPLMWSVAFGKLETCMLLMMRGADIDARDNRGNTVLGRAMLHGNSETEGILDMIGLFGTDNAKTLISKFSECLKGG